MDILIPRNTTIPCEKTEKFQNTKDNQTKINIKLYQGERKLAKENKFIYKLQINIPPKPRGKVIIEVTFSLDISGILKVSAKEISGGQTSNLDIKMDNVMEEQTIEDEGLEKYVLFNTIPLSLGFELDNGGYENQNGEMIFIMKRNSKIPCKKKFTFFNEKDYQNEFILKIYEGERLLAIRNKKLKELVIKTPSKPKGEIKIDIIFSLYDKNTLNVEVYVNDLLQDDIEKIINISSLNEDEVNDIIIIAEKMEKKDLEQINKIKYKNELINYIQKVKSITEEMIEWINTHPKENKEKYNEMLFLFKNKLK